MHHLVGTLPSGTWRIVLGGLACLLLPFVWASRGFFLSDDFEMVVFGATVRASAIDWLPTDRWSWYRPLPALSWILNYRVAGASPLGFHLPNVGLHAVNIALSFAIWRRFGWDVAPAALAAALFAWSPVTPGGVVWISARPDLLATTFMLCAVWVAVSAKDQWSWSRAGLLAAFTLAAITSKESAFGLAPVVAVLALFPAMRRAVPMGTFPMRYAAAVGALLTAFLAIRVVVWGSTLGGYGTPLQWTRLITSPIHGFLPSATALAFAFGDPFGPSSWLVSAIATLFAATVAPAPVLCSLGASVASAHLVDPAVAFWEFDRFYYFAAVWSSGALAAIAWRVAALRRRDADFVFVAISGCLLAVNLSYLVIRLTGFDEAAAITSRVHATLRRATDVLPAGSVISCAFLPDSLDGIYVYRNGCAAHVSLVWPDGSVTGHRIARREEVFFVTTDGGALRREKHTRGRQSPSR